MSRYVRMPGGAAQTYGIEFTQFEAVSDRVALKHVVAL
jgi:hypothetical protein